MTERNLLKDNIYTTYEKTKNFKKIFSLKKISNIGTLTAKVDKKKKIDPFKEILKSFIPEKDFGKIQVKKKINQLGYEANYNMEADYFIESLGIIFEFDGPDHYNNPFKIIRDERKYRELNSIKKKGKKVKIRIIRIPYYYQLSKDVAKFIFDDLIKYFSKDLENLPKEGFYRDKKYEKAISKVYKNIFTGKPAQNEIEIPACGLQKSERVPSEYTETGIEKILNDFKGTAIEPPKSIEHQYMWCLKYYIDDVKTYDNGDKNKRLILPTWHSQFMKKYEENISNRNDDYLQCIFTRNKESILRTAKIK